MREAGRDEKRLTEWVPGPPGAMRSRAPSALVAGAARACRRLDVVVLLWLAYGGVLAVLPTSLQPAAVATTADIARAFTALAWIEIPGNRAAHLVDPGIAQAPAAVYYLLLHAVLAGGVLSLLHADRPRPLVGRFGAGAGLYAGRLIRLTLVGGLALATVVQIDEWLLSAEAAAESGSAMAPLQPARLLLLVASFLLLDLVIGVARVRAVVTDSRSMVLEAVRSAALVLRHPIRFGAVYGGVGVWAATLGAAYVAARARLAPDPASWEARLLTALYVAASIWTVMFLWAALMALIKGVVEEELAAAD